MARPLTDLLKKDIDWRWDNTHADAFRAINESLLHALNLALHKVLSTMHPTLS